MPDGAQDGWAVAPASLSPDSDLFDEVHSTFENYTELLWIRDKVGKLIPWHLNKMQRMTRARKLADLEAGKRPRWLELKYRRGGMSTLEIGENFELVATGEGQNVVTLAHLKPFTKKLFRIAETFYKNLEPELRPHRRYENKTEMDFDQSDSLYYIGTAGSRGFGRGDTLQRVHWSEVAWSRFDDGLMTGLEEACSHGTMVLESTANGPRGLFYDLVTEAATKPYSDWNLIFLPWFLDAGNSRPLSAGEHIEPGIPNDEIPAKFCEAEVELIAMAQADWSVSITPEMLKWRRKKWANTKPRTELFHQEYPHTWRSAFVSVSGLFFEANHLQLGEQLIRAPIVREEYCDGEFLAWQEPDPEKDYVWGADCSEGRPQGDASYLAIGDAETGQLVARWHGRCLPHVFGGKVIPKYCMRYNHAFGAPERNNHGHSVITALTQAAYGNLYTYKRLGKHGEFEDAIGWDTNKQTRDLMLQYLRESMGEGWMSIPDPVFWRECWNFILKDGSDERYEAPKHQCSGDGCPTHDDSIIGHAIMQQMRRKRVGLRLRT